MSDDLLPMFFDDDFVPHAYLDALFAASGTPAGEAPPGPSSLTNPKYIQLLQQRSSTLLTHLDFYTSELTNNLEQQISKLHASNSVVSYSYEASNEKTLKPTTRLEYYIDSLSISVQSLNDTVSSVTTKMCNLSTTNETTTRLLELTKAKNNLIKVQQSLETIKSIVEIAVTRQPSPVKKSRTAPTSTRAGQDTLTINSSQLSSALSVLQVTIAEQIAEKGNTEKETEIDKELITKIDDLCALLTVFRNLGDFHAVYAAFVKVIQAEKEGYLRTKTLEDELFEKVLK